MRGIKEIYGVLCAWAPVESAEEWDNPGLLVRACEETDGVLCALDITAAAVREAAEKRCGLIVSHHPVIFRPLRALSAGSVPALLVCGGISAVCMHTNLDRAAGGVNDVLAARLNLANLAPFAGGIGRIGTLPHETEPAALAADIAARLSAPVRYADAGRPVLRAAVVSGSGGDFVREAARAGADCLITGEAGHHDALDALEAGVSLFAATHFSTERFIAGALAERLRAAFPDLRVYESASDAEPFRFVGAGR